MPRRPRDPGVPTTPAQRFGTELRAFREEAGLSRPELASKLGYTPQRIGQVECGDSPSKDFASDCDSFFKTNGVFYRNWKWIQDVGTLLLLPPGFPEFLECEGEAVTMHVFEAMAVTGLFQTYDYAYEQLKEGRTDDEIVSLVETRIARQEILACEDPCHVVVVFDEWAIRRPIGDTSVMRCQVQHLIDLAQRANISLHIVPTSCGAYAGLPGAFTVLGLRDGADVAYEEGHLGGQMYKHRDTVRAYEVCFDKIRGVALTVDDSLKLLYEILESL